MFCSQLLKSWKVEISNAVEPASSTRSVALDDEGVLLPEVTFDGRIYRLNFLNLALFEINLPEQRVVGQRLSPQLTDEDIAHALDDHCAPRILAHQGYLVLHGSGIELDSKLAVFLGQTGVGKSTLAASFDQSGHRLLGDDAIIASEHEGKFFGEATYRSMRLLPSSVAAIYGEEVSTSPMAHYSDKLHVASRASDDSSMHKLPIGAIFYITSESASQTVSARGLASRDACFRVLEQSFSLDPSDTEHALRRLSQVTALVSKVPVYELTYPRDFEALPAIRSRVTEVLKGA